MNSILGKKVKLPHVLLGILVIILGLLGLLFGPALISIPSLAITSFAALYMVYGRPNTMNIFSAPVSPIKTICKYFFMNLVVSMTVSLILQYLLKWDLRSNPVNEGFQPILFFIIPIMLLGEELFSIYFLAIFSSKYSVPVSSVLSAIIFGLIHYSTYNNGNILHTLVHILLIQGVARLIFNQAAIKSNSITTSWIVHVLFDFSAILTSVFLS